MKKVLVITGAVMLLAGCKTRTNFGDDIKLREGKPIGFKNPAQTCWLNAALSLLFGGNSSLAKELLSLDRNKIEDPFVLALYDLIKDMHDPDQKWLAYKDEQNIAGPFWQELGKKLVNISFNETREDLEAFDTILNGIRKTIPKFDTTFGARAFGNVFKKKLDFNAFEAFAPGVINANTITEMMKENGIDPAKAQKLPPPELLWIRCNAAPKTSIKFALAPQLEKLFKVTDPVCYDISGLTIYKIYQSTLESGLLSEEKVHYAALIPAHNGEGWYLIDDSVVTHVPQSDFVLELAQQGTLITKHIGAENEIFETKWYPSILQYTLRPQSTFVSKKSAVKAKEKKRILIEKEEEINLELQKKMEEEQKDRKFAEQLYEQEKQRQKQEEEDLLFAQKLQQEEQRKQQEEEDFELAQKIQQQLEEE